MRNRGIFLGVLLSLGCLVACGQSTSSSKRVAYVDSSSSSSAMSPKTEELSPEEVAAQEGNHADQVVVQITADGYVTSHGDHYHFYSGQVGFEALISQDLVLTDSSYQLAPAHVVSDVVDGHIIKLGEDYYLYLTTDTPQQLR